MRTRQRHSGKIRLFLGGAAVCAGLAFIHVFVYNLAFWQNQKVSPANFKELVIYSSWTRLDCDPEELQKVPHVSFSGDEELAFFRTATFSGRVPLWKVAYWGEASLVEGGKCDITIGFFDGKFAIWGQRGYYQINAHVRKQYDEFQTDILRRLNEQNENSSSVQ